MFAGHTHVHAFYGTQTGRSARRVFGEVLKQVASGMDWKSISEEWNGKVSKEAIAEAVRLASEYFVAHSEEPVREAASR